MSVNGLRVVVTGSTRGLGLAFARDLLDRGARVVINGVDPDRCASVAGELGAVGVAGSVADEDVANALVSTCVEAYGGVDAVVNNAGIVRDGMFKKLEVGAFDEVIGVHLRGTWLVTRAAVLAMGDALTVVNVTSGTSLYGLLGQANYAAAKGGINSLTTALTIELGGRGVRLNAVYPRAHTDMTGQVGAFPEVAQHLGPPEDVAPLVSYLVSPDSAHVAGQLIAFDGRALDIWTHPAVGAGERRERAWTDEEITAHLAPDNLQTLNPDAIGHAMWDAFGVKHPRPTS